MEERGEHRWHSPFAGKSILGDCYANPVEHEGTYRLPEAQMDRFLFKIEIDYPSLDHEIQIIKNASDRQAVRETDLIGRVATRSKRLSIIKASSNRW